MADYKNIKGFNIQYLDSDPPNPIEGQMWFNSTTQTLKGVEAGGAPVGTWASGTSMPTAINNNAGFGQQTDSISAAGVATGQTVGGYTNVYSYNGTSWSTLSPFPTSAYASASVGTSSADGFLSTGATGTPTLQNFTLLYNGSTWTAGANANVTAAYRDASTRGSTTAAIMFGGYTAAPLVPGITNTESWDGTSWTIVNAMNTGKNESTGFGVQTAALSATGQAAGTYLTNVESWDGTSWTEVAEVNTAVADAGQAGLSTSGIKFGGANAGGVTGATEFYNGTTWTELSDLATGRSIGASLGTSDSALLAGGYSGGSLSTVEEWNAPPISIKTFTTS
jgi:hypothetical protein